MREQLYRIPAKRSNQQQAWVTMVGLEFKLQLADSEHKLKLEL